MSNFFFFLENHSVRLVREPHAQTLRRPYGSSVTDRSKLVLATTTNRRRRLNGYGHDTTTCVDCRRSPIRRITLYRTRRFTFYCISIVCSIRGCFHYVVGLRLVATIGDFRKRSHLIIIITTTTNNLAGGIIILIL